MKQFFDQYLACERGNILVETAIALPMLVFLFFGGFDLTRYIYLIHKSDQTTALVADTIARMQQRNIPVDIDQLLMLAQQNLSFGSYRPTLKIGAETVSLLPNGDMRSIWNDVVGDTTIDCSAMSILPNYSIEDIDPKAPRQTLVRVQICIETYSGFYLSNFLPLRSIILKSISLRSVPFLGVWNDA